MFSLQDLLGQAQGSQAVEQISQNLGADSGTVNSAIQMALPLLLGGLAKNAQTPDGAQNIDQALAADHDGSLLGSLTDFLAGGIPGPDNATRQTNGAGILGHILGNNQGQIAQEVSQQSGLNIAQVANLMITLAPIVMGYLGKQKQENNLDASGVSDLLAGHQEKIKTSGNSVIDMASKMLDRDGDGSALDDLASMAAGFFMK